MRTRKLSILFLLSLLLVIFLLGSVQAVSGCCSHHDGVCCECGAQLDGRVICNDGWTESSCYYSGMVMCNPEVAEERCYSDNDCNLIFDWCSCSYKCILKNSVIACVDGDENVCTMEVKPVPKCECINNKCEPVFETIVNITECEEGEIEYYNCDEGFIENYWIKRKCVNGKWEEIYYPMIVGGGACDCRLDSSVCEKNYSCIIKTGKCEKFIILNATATITGEAIVTNPILKNCEGCILDDKCVPIGYRTSNKYCDIDTTMRTQKSSEQFCNNNFECEINVCVNGKCISGGLIQGILNFFKKIFGL